jgi:hypothetical protein
MRRKVSTVVLAGVCGLAGFTAVARTADKADKPTGQFVHAVMFTLKKDAPAGAAEAMIADCHELLRPIPTVRDLRAGPPAEKASPNAQTGYQVGLLVMFDNAEGLKTYLAHPLHDKFVERHLPKIDVEKLLVYDFANQKK